MTITADDLSKVMRYDASTGNFLWVVKPANRVSVGDVVGSRDVRGYVRVRFKGVRYWSHQLAFLAMTGSLPTGPVDHINGDKSDHSWGNLRASSQRENAYNTPAHRDNKLGIKNVSFHGEKYRAVLYLEGKQVSLGRFDTPEEAAAVARAARKTHHKEYAYDF